MSFLALVSPPTPNTHFQLSAGHLQLNDLLWLTYLNDSLTKFNIFFSKPVLWSFLFAITTNIVPTTQHRNSSTMSASFFLPSTGLIALSCDFLLSTLPTFNPLCMCISYIPGPLLSMEAGTQLCSGVRKHIVVHACLSSTQDSTLHMAGFQKYMLNESVVEPPIWGSSSISTAGTVINGLLASWLFSILLLLPDCPVFQWLPRAKESSKKD